MGCARSARPSVPARAAIRLSLLALVAGAAVTALGMPAGAAGRPAAGPAASGNGRGASLVLEAQSPWVLASQPRFALQLRITGPTPAADRLSLGISLYPRLLTRSAFEQTLSSAPTGSPLSRIAPVTVSDPGEPLTIGMTVTTGAAAQAATQAEPASAVLDLRCAGSDTCAGVYPLTVSLQDDTSGQVLDRLTTYLTYAAAPSTSKLRFALVVPVGSPVTVHRDARSPAEALGMPTRGEAARLAAVVAELQSTPQVPVTVLADPYTVQGLAAAGSEGARAVGGLARLSSPGSADELPPQPYVPIDLGALAAAGLTGEPVHQMLRGAEALARAGIRTPEPVSARGPLAWSSGPTVWVATGGVGPGLAAGLRQVGANRVVVPDSALAPSASRLGITQTFELQLGRNDSVTAAAADGSLAAHFLAAGADSVLAANQLLADLAMIQSELPNARLARGVVAVPPAGWQADAEFLSTVLHGLVNDPDVQPVTLSDFFAQVPAGGADGEPLSRRPASSAQGPELSRTAAAQLSEARTRLDGFDYAVVGSPPVLDQLSSLLLAAESDRLRSPSRPAAVATFERLLDGQLSLVQLATDRTITLTARTGSIPVTFLSSAPYGVRGTVSLSSDKFQFPHGSSRTGFVIARPTNPLRVVVEARTSGDLPLHVVLTAPRADPSAPPLVIAHGVITVRATATSLVGVVLTLLAVAVLAGWWARTWRVRRRARVRRA